MKAKNVECPLCGTMNYNLNLDETKGWMECSNCHAVTCSMSEWKHCTTKIPRLRIKWMEDNPVIEGQCL